MNKQRISFLTILIISLIGCTSDLQFKTRLVKTLEENPQIVFDAIKNNPEKFMQTVKVAANKAQGNMAKNAQVAQQKEIEEAIKSPLQPSITSKEIIKGNKNSPITIVESAVYEDHFYEQINEQKDEKGKGSINDLLFSGNTWDVE